MTPQPVEGQPPSRAQEVQGQVSWWTRTFQNHSCGPKQDSCLGLSVTLISCVHLIPKWKKKQEMKPVNIKETRRQTEKKNKKSKHFSESQPFRLSVGTSRHPKGE